MFTIVANMRGPPVCLLHCKHVVAGSQRRRDLIGSGAPAERKRGLTCIAARITSRVHDGAVSVIAEDIATMLMEEGITCQFGYSGKAAMIEGPFARIA
jgi:hypothetical protein